MSLQRFLAVHRKFISNIFFVLEILMVGFLVAMYLQAFNNYRSIFLFVYETGLKLGQTAIILYVITLLPGIITRLQWFPKITQPIASIILPFRRHFGVLMFLTAFVHMSFTTTLPYYAQNDFMPPALLPKMANFQVMGLIAWSCLFPMWLTSNDFSQKKLGKNWKVLHRITYVALIFIFLHTAMQKTVWMYVIGPALLLEAISWITYWVRESRKPKSAPVVPPISPTTPPVSVPQQPLNPPSSDSSV